MWSAENDQSSSSRLSTVLIPNPWFWMSWNATLLGDLARTGDRLVGISCRGCLLIALFVRIIALADLGAMLVLFSCVLAGLNDGRGLARFGVGPLSAEASDMNVLFGSSSSCSSSERWAPGAGVKGTCEGNAVRGVDELVDTDRTGSTDDLTTGS